MGLELYVSGVRSPTQHLEARYSIMRDRWLFRVLIETDLRNRAVCHQHVLETSEHE